jgi:hypothetical protein
MLSVPIPRFQVQHRLPCQVAERVDGERLGCCARAAGRCARPRRRALGDPQGPVQGVAQDLRDAGDGVELTLLLSLALTLLLSLALTLLLLLALTLALTLRLPRWPHCQWMRRWRDWKRMNE